MTRQNSALTPAQYVLNIEYRFIPLQDLERAKQMRAYLKDKFEFIGIPAPTRRAAVKELMKQRWSHPEEIIRVASLLWERPQREYRYAAIDLLRREFHLLKLQHLESIRDLLQREAWWETVDGLSGVIGAVLHQEQRNGTNVELILNDWLVHPDFWVRRSAMLHQLGWRLETNSERLFQFSMQLAGESEFFIRKAIGWALRDYARWNPNLVRDFVSKNQTDLSGLTIREACKHL